jgi:EmrB/QacA subfamily drug resistance transporter
VTSILDDSGDATTKARAGGRRAPRWDVDHPHYRWVALSNTTIGMLIATVNASIVLISLPAIFRGIGMNPLAPENVGYLLWMIMGYLLVSAVLVVSLGRLGDLVGRVRMYNLGFAVFTAASIALALTPGSGSGAALWIIGWRLVQAVGGSMLFANSTAILTDAFPAHRRGMALGINQIAAIAGSFVGLVLGGVLSEISWRSVFWVSVPIGIVGTLWSYKSLHELTVRRSAKIDWLGNGTFAVGLSILLAGITYGIQPYGGSSTGWTNPWVLAGLIGGVVLLVLFCVVETKVDEPMFRLGLFRNRAFALGNLAGLLSSMGRGGLQFMLIIWLQGIWLPLHGYSFESTPLWAGIFMLPMTLGFLVAGPLSGWLSDRYGARPFATGGMLIAALSFFWFAALPVDFTYWMFAAALFCNGFGMGLFASPNRAAVMNALPANRRGVGGGMSTTFQNTSMVLSIGIFFSLMIVGLAASLPATMQTGLTAHGVPAAQAHAVAGLPPVAVLFASLLGYNPVQSLLGSHTLAQLHSGDAHYLTGHTFFPSLISGPFHDGLIVAFAFAIAACVVAAAASWFMGEKFVHADDQHETPIDFAQPEAPAPETESARPQVARS